MIYGSTLRRLDSSTRVIGGVLAWTTLVCSAFAAKPRPRLGGAEATVSPPSAPAKGPDRVVLFSGKKEEIAQNWIQRSDGQPAHWKMENGGAMIATESDIYSKQRFSDFQLHVEFRVPYMPDAHGQERGNSGVFLQGRYEIQVLDSYGIADPGTGDCGAIYGQYAPLVAACNPPLQWQSYDIVFRGARVNGDNKVVEPAHVTIMQNGIIIQNNQTINGPTGDPLDEAVGDPGPVRLQYHGYPVAFRNIWVVPLPPHGALHY